MGPLTGRISGHRLAGLLGSWRQPRTRPTAADLAAALRSLLLDGQLPPGTRLPSERELAGVLGTSRTLTTAAYDRLRSDGLLASRQGSGSWTTLPGHGFQGAFWPPEEVLLDLAHASPTAPQGLAAAAEAVRPAFAAELTGHGYHPRGLAVLRGRIAERYTRRGLPTTPEQIMVTNGSQHAFALVLHALTAPGERVLVEHPTYPNALDAIRAVHARPTPVTLDPAPPTEAAGWDIDSIAATLRRTTPALAYLVPDFHNPTGLRMPAQTRRQVAELLRRSRTPVVVDETMAELDLDGEPDRAPPPFAAALADLAITIGSASKTVWGGLRLGWLRAPADMVARLVTARPATDLGSPVFEQLLLAELLGDMDAVLAQRRAELCRRRAVLLDAIERHCPQWRVRRPSGGLSLWCQLDQPSSSRLAVLAAQHGVRVVPGARFSAHGGLERWLRLPFTLPEDALADAMARVALAWSAVSGSSRTAQLVDLDGTDGAVA